MPSTPKPAQSNEERGLVWHVDPNDPTGLLVNHLPNTKTNPSKPAKPRPKSSRKKKS